MLARLVEIAKDYRQHLRLRMPRLSICIDGTRYKTDDWSLGGFKITHCAKTLQPLEQVSGEIGVPREGCKGRFLAEVVWTGDDGAIGLRFLAVSPQVLAIMAETQITQPS